MQAFSPVLNYFNRIYPVRAAGILAVEHSHLICSFIPQSIYSQISMKKTNLGKVILSFFIRKISHIKVYARINAWVNLLLGWKVRSYQQSGNPWEVGGAQRNMDTGGTLKVFRATCSLNKDQLTPRGPQRHIQLPQKSRVLGIFALKFKSPQH